MASATAASVHRGDRKHNHESRVRPGNPPPPAKKQRRSNSPRRESLPPIIDEDDPMLDYPPENWIASMIGTAGQLYRFSDDLVYKSNVTPREADLMEAAGDLTMQPLTRVVCKGSRPDTGTKAVIMEAGTRFRARDVAPKDRQAVVTKMFVLLGELHRRDGIVHGDIKESKFLWGRGGRLKIIDFSSARFIDENPGSWNSSYATEAYFTPQRMKRREQSRHPSGHGAGTSTSFGGTPAPRVFDDYYALAITLWSMYSGKKPRNRQFNQKNIKRSDLMEVGDDSVRLWIKKVLKMAGCRLSSPDPGQTAPDAHVPSVVNPGQIDVSQQRNGRNYVQ
ncbi:hypothetical protein B0T25DRAFT_546998 [Lasiosphaeria hispida]|uniref:Protein kinase domain-containing protein n=1 Tax=Lasiosphaeria hispida TaxID=260671 RepID=A0AAJ0HDW6_9PEZI|nr:hypothetical protein B0T25DRAFT_546998 [Lasiosphaeria hispida]